MSAMNGGRSRDAFLGYLLLSPTILLMAALMAWPLIQAIILSFHDVQPMTLRTRFVGLQNYVQIFGDPDFWNALINNFIWLGGSLFMQMTLGVMFALLMNRQLPGRGLARALILFPYMLPVVVTALVWHWMLEPLHGIINYGLQTLGFAGHDWLGSMPEAMISVVTVGSWRVFPFVVIVVLARLQSIPPQLYEAAAVDGASSWSRFWDITMPQLGNVLFAVVLLRAIWDFREFDLIFLMTGGGPVAATKTLPLLVYERAFQVFQMGRALAVAVVMLGIMIVFIGLYFRLAGGSRRMEEA